LNLKPDCSRMKLRFPNLTFFIDAGGRYSHSKDVPIVFAGIAIESRVVEEVRESLLTAASGSLCKWSHGNKGRECASTIFRLLGKRQLLAVVRIVWKHTDEWDRYFAEGRRLYEQSVRITQRAVPFAKPMATFKLHQFGITCGDLIGFFARRNRHRLPSREEPIQPFEITAVFDSDIQGQANQQVCKDVFARAVPEMKRTPKHLRISPRLKVEIKTEQEEPLLFLADYLAGYHYSRMAYQTQKESDWTSLLKAVEPLVSKVPITCHHVSEEDFRQDYFLPADVFDGL
jgi:hypothetical protein